MALWAHGLDHGIVVNIGQQQTIAVPVVRGGRGAGEMSDDGCGVETLCHGKLDGKKDGCGWMWDECLNVCNQRFLIAKCC